MTNKTVQYVLPLLLGQMHTLMMVHAYALVSLHMYR